MGSVPKILVPAAAGLILFWQPATGAAQIVVETGPQAEITPQGLHRVPPAIMPGTWVRPDLDLARYGRVFFLPTLVEFREIPQRRYSARALANQTAFPVNAQRRARLRELFGAAFYAAVSNLRSYELTDELGRDVLMIQGFLTDVASGVPPDDTTAYGVLIRMAWEATIVMELRDAMSNELLARTVEILRINGPMDPTAVYALTPRFAQEWSSLLIGKFRALSDLTGRPDVGVRPGAWPARP